MSSPSPWQQFQKQLKTFWHQLSGLRSRCSAIARPLRGYGRKFKQSCASLGSGLARQFQQFWGWILALLSHLFASIARQVRQGFGCLSRVSFRSCLAFLQTHLAEAIAVVFLAISMSVIFFTFVPSSLVFEGNLIVKEVSFTYSGQPDKLFLNSIRSLQALELESEQKLTLSGQFSSTKNPNLAQIPTLELNLNSPQSKLIVQPLDPKTPSQLELAKLRIQPQTQVQNLNYNFTQNQLSFSLAPSPANPNTLQLFLGEQPLRIIAEGYRSPQLPLDNDEFNILELSFIPANTEVNFTLDKPANLYLTLPDLEQADRENWLWGNLTVEDANFVETLQTENLEDDLNLSTILSGTVRMAGKELRLENKQFLLVQGQPGIQKLPRIQLHNSAPEGLEIRIHGQAKSLATGLDRDFPVNRIQAGILDRWMPPELINIVLSFAAAVTGYLLPWLFVQKS